MKFLSLIQRRQASEKTRVLEELKNIPIVTVACKRAGIAHATFYRWLKADKEFAEAVEEANRVGTELMNDMGESQLITLMKNGNAGAIRYWLEHNHPKYMRAQRNVVVEHNAKDFRVEIPYEQGQ